LVGTDAQGIQLRALAHYVNHPDLTDEIVNGKKEDGTDIHSKNVIRLNGLCKAREPAKTFVYSWLLGATPPKTAKVLDCSVEEGRLAQNLFIDSTPGLKEFLYKKSLMAKRGYIIAVDGRKVAVPSDHLAMTALFQSFEQAVMKTACMIWHQEARKYGFWFKQVGFIHDEFQTEVEPEAAFLLADLQCKAIREAGERLKLRCPQEGTSTIGFNWRDTH
jgi:DNA polymerase-1